MARDIHSIGLSCQHVGAMTGNARYSKRQTGAAVLPSGLPGVAIASEMDAGRRHPLCLHSAYMARRGLGCLSIRRSKNP